MPKAMPRYMYGDPLDAAIRNEERKCTGCRHLLPILDREFCGIGRRTLTKCRKYDPSVKKG